MKNRDVTYFLFHYREVEVFKKLKDAIKESELWGSWCIVRRDWNNGNTKQEMDVLVKKSESFRSDCFYRSGIEYLINK